MTYRQIILAGAIGINQKEESLTWDGWIGTIQLSALCIYLGETRPTAMPETITVVSHRTGVEKTFRHLANVGNEIRYSADDFVLVVQCSMEQFDRLHEKAVSAKLRGRTGYKFG